MASSTEHWPKADNWTRKMQKVRKARWGKYIIYIYMDMEISDWKMELRGNDLATCISIQPEFKPYGSELDIDKTWQNSVKNHKKLQMDANGKKDKKDWPSMEATSKVPQVPRHSKLDKRGSLPCLVHRCWAEVHVTALGRFWVNESSWMRTLCNEGYH